MQTIPLTNLQAAQVAAENKISVDDLLKLGFEIVAGAANVEAAVPTVPVNEALLATAKELFKAGRKAENTQKGRATRVLGQEEGIAPYSIVVYGPIGK